MSELYGILSPDCGISYSVNKTLQAIRTTDGVMFRDVVDALHNVYRNKTESKQLFLYSKTQNIECEFEIIDLVYNCPFIPIHKNSSKLNALLSSDTSLNSLINSYSIYAIANWLEYLECVLSARYTPNLFVSEFFSTYHQAIRYMLSFNSGILFNNLDKQALSVFLREIQTKLSTYRRADNLSSNKSISTLEEDKSKIYSTLAFQLVDKDASEFLCSQFFPIHLGIHSSQIFPFHEVFKRIFPEGPDPLNADSVYNSLINPLFDY